MYPASFQSTGSGSLPGWGDIKGVISKLDYFKHLGVDVVWLSPIYKSPQVDMGYDIADYKDIDPRYGTLEDVDELIAGLHKRDMKLMMDLVVNHTSDQHDWFKRSRSSKDDPKRSWYHWQPAKYDEHGNRQPPNNWAMILGEAHSAWTWDEKTQEYYLALFTPEQPDLNWENPDVRAAVHDVLHFWLKRGASGFRMDVINHISKTPGYPDAPITSPGSKYQPGYKYYANGPRLHEWLQAMNREVLSKYDTITVGEMPFVRSEEEILKVVGAKRGELNMIFIFEMVDIDNDETGFRLTLRDWNTNEIKKIFNKWQTLMIDRNGWNSLFIENHGMISETYCCQHEVLTRIRQTTLAPCPATAATKTNTASSAPNSSASCRPPSPAQFTSTKAKSSGSATCHPASSPPSTKTSRPSTTGTRQAISIPVFTLESPPV